MTTTQIHGSPKSMKFALTFKTRKDLKEERRLALRELAQAKDHTEARKARERLDAVNTQLSALDNQRSARTAPRSTVVSGQKPRRRS